MAACVNAPDAPHPRNLAECLNECPRCAVESAVAEAMLRRGRYWGTDEDDRNVRAAIRFARKMGAAEWRNQFGLGDAVRELCREWPGLPPKHEGALNV